jgi:hypothetical protein
MKWSPTYLLVVAASFTVLITASSFAPEHPKPYVVLFLCVFTLLKFEIRIWHRLALFVPLVVVKLLFPSTNKMQISAHAAF